MKKLFLTSSVHAVAHDIAKRVDLSKGKGLVFIDTAAEPVNNDKEWLKNDKAALVKSGFSVEDYTITSKSRKQLGRDLVKYDFIYVSGGDTPYLLEQSQKSGFFSLIKNMVLKEGKTYIGTSAGSIIAGPIVPEYLFEGTEVPDKSKRKGFGFVNFTIVPHWGDEFFRDKYLNRRLKMVYRKNQAPLLLLTNHQYVYVQDDWMKVVDLKNEI